MVKKSYREGLPEDVLEQLVNCFLEVPKESLLLRQIYVFFS